MISTQRLMIIAILLNIVFGIVDHVQAGDSAESFDELDNTNSYIDGNMEEFQNDEGIWGTVKSSSARLMPEPVVNVVKSSYIFFSIMLKSVNPFSINSLEYDSFIEKRFADLVMLLRCLIMLVLSMEIYFITKSKKVN